jgi:hypothetical protein
MTRGDFESFKMNWRKFDDGGKWRNYQIFTRVFNFHLPGDGIFGFFFLRKEGEVGKLEVWESEKLNILNVGRNQKLLP